RISGRPALALASTRIEGDLDLRDAALCTDASAPCRYKSPVAARGEGLTVDGSVLAQGCEANGEVRLPRARVGGDLDFSGARFPAGRVVIGATHVGGRLLFEQTEFGATGKEVLSMVSASVAGRFGWTPSKMPNNSGMDLRYSSVGYLDDAK